MPAEPSPRQAMLEALAGSYRRDSVQDNWVRQLCVRAAAPWLRPDAHALEIGCSDGYMTEMLAARLARVTVVEASATFVHALAARRLAKVEVWHGLVEHYTPARPFDVVFATWVLTHIVDAKTLLTRLRGWLAPGGHLVVSVPNVRVLSRQLALHMGLLPELHALTANDLDHGHVRAYDAGSVRRELEAAGLEVVHQCGLMIKPLADFQMDALYARGVLDASHVEGLYRLGLEYPDLCSATLCICRVPPHG